MSLLLRLFRDVQAAAAAELALVIPLLLTIMCGSFEIGNYFLDEHILVKAVRDGARFAARQNFTNYPNGTCNGTSTAVGDPVLTDTRNVVKTGLVSGGSDRLPYWVATTISVTMTCSTTAGGQTLSGIYRGRTSGAPIVTVSAAVPYTPVLRSFGFRGTGLNLNATQQAAVMGI
jgi:Flp pilus assembly protein TadG